MAALTIAMPKGRLTEDGIACLARAGYVMSSVPAGAVPSGNGSSGSAETIEGTSNAGRKLILESTDGRFRLVLAKPADVPIFVEYGAADLGIAGLDVVREAERDVYEPLSLPFGHCRLVVAGPRRVPAAKFAAGTQPESGDEIPAPCGGLLPQAGSGA